MSSAEATLYLKSAARMRKSDKDLDGKATGMSNGDDDEEEDSSNDDTESDDE